MAQHPIQDAFRAVAFDLDAARSDEVPTFAPEAFRSAVEHQRRARDMFAECHPADEIGYTLEQARAALIEARTKSEKARELLADLATTRTASWANDQLRFRAPEALNQAEAAYRTAVRQAEAGDLAGAGASAERAAHLFKDARLTAVEGGLIGSLRQSVAAAGHIDREAEALVEGLEEDLEQARSGELAGGDLTRNIVAAARRIGTLVPGMGLEPGLGGDFIFDPGPGWAPGTFEPPPPPVTMRVTGRTDSSVKITWRNRGGVADANIVERRQGDGLWQLVVELPVEGEWQEYEDTGLLPDQLYCYRIRVRNSYGSSVTPNDDRACAFTKDGNGITLGRAQLFVRVADISNAGTSSDILVRLTSPLPTFVPKGNHTWLDYGPEYAFVGGWVKVSDDFDRGREFTYDLSLDFLDDVGDITMLSIVNDSSDALAIAELALLANGHLVFDRYFGETKSTALWVGDGAPIYTMFHPELRAHPAWPSSLPLPSPQIPNRELVERIEGLLGHVMHNEPLKWGKLDGDDWVEVSRKDASTLRVTADLEIEIDGPNLELDVEFDVALAVTCNGATAALHLDILNFEADVSFNLLHDLLSLGIVEFFDDNIERAIEKAWEPISKSFNFETGGLCPQIEVDANGNLNFSLG